MVEREIIWTRTAAKQRREILRYWTKRNGTFEYAGKLIALVSNRTKIIQNNPEAFVNANFPDTRVSALGHFSIFYKVTAKAIS